MGNSPLSAPGPRAAENDECGLCTQVCAHLSEKSGAPLDAGLYLVATPIGNLGDITLRALNVLARADLICCEDTRRSRKLLAHFAIKTALSTYHEYNAQKERPGLLARMKKGQAVALISDAGTPLISDPGYKLVEEACAQDISVTAVPGPAAPITALILSGLPTDRFFFEGFLPTKSGQRRKRLEVLSNVPATLIFFETANRLAASLGDMEACLGTRKAVLLKEMTKRYETIIRGPLGRLGEDLEDGELKGEFVVVVEQGEGPSASDRDIQDQLTIALEEMSFRDAVKAVADGLGVHKNRVYALGLHMKKGLSVKGQD